MIKLIEIDMSSNYFLRKNFCSECGRYDQIYIGKDWIGYRFIFNVDDKFKNADDWIAEILIPSNKIFDECGKEVDKQKFIEMIKSKIHEDSFSSISDNVTSDGKFDYWHEKGRE